jgi:vancomycin permeability regulator SanA
MLGAVPLKISLRPLSPRLRRWSRRVVTAGALGVAAAVLAMAGSAFWVQAEASGHVFSEESVPAAPVALVLGAQVYPDGTVSAYLAARLDTARRLFESGKVKAILVSGDHGRWEYDEPGAMEVYLIARGVPASRIVVDYAGFDTYDSCARARRIFGVRQAIVVTQTFHLDRAVALCRTLGVDAAGVGDESVKFMHDLWLRNKIRERPAAVKAVVDVVSHRDPVLLGRHETGVEDALRDS